MFTIRPHQKQAVTNFNTYYRDHTNRGILSMCCGSGKTFTSYQIIKSYVENGDTFFLYITSRLLLINR
jgi:superfamily II DNA or RNA helicase